MSIVGRLRWAQPFPWTGRCLPALDPSLGRPAAMSSFMKASRHEVRRSRTWKILDWVRWRGDLNRASTAQVFGWKGEAVQSLSETRDINKKVAKV